HDPGKGRPFRIGSCASQELDVDARCSRTASETGMTPRVVETGVSGSDKSSWGNYFEDFHLGQNLAHAVPRTVTVGDVAMYVGLYGMRFALQSSDEFAKSVGLSRSPVDDLLVF